MTLLNLPDELLIQIASELGFLDLIHFRQTCMKTREVVNSNAALQYALELHIAGMVDNPACRLVPGDRLRILREKEEGWRRLDLSDRKVLPLQHNPSGIYDLTGGVLLLGERRHPDGHTGTDNVHTVHLHSAFREEDPRIPSLWHTVDLGRQVIDVGLAIQEHDLIAIVTYSYINEPQLWASIDIHLIQHSTGQPHPAAKKPVIHFDSIHYLPGHCSIMLEISGDTLCFLLNNYFPFVTADPVTLVIYDWKMGDPKAGQKRLYSDPTMFNSFILLSPDTLVLPIVPSNALEICYFGKELAAPPPPPFEGEGPPPRVDVPMLETAVVLELPALATGALVLRMTCRCEPNPRGPPSAATHLDGGAPFSSNPEYAVMILHIHVRLPLHTSRVYTMIVHRSSLLQMYHCAMRYRTSFSAPPAATSAPGNSTPTSGIDTAQDPSAHPLVPEWLLDGPPQPFLFQWIPPPNPTPLASDEPVTIAWSAWGPRLTRWFQDELAGTRWITTTSGQRFVRMRPDGRIHVFDFNHRMHRKLLVERRASGEPLGSRAEESVVSQEAYEWSRRSARAQEEEEEEAQMMALDEWGGDDEGEEGGDDDDHMPGEWVVAEVEADEPQDLEEVLAARQRAEQNANVGNVRSSDMDPERRVKAMLGTTVISEPEVWEDNLESSLPYIETSVRTTEEYESALIDEDILVGLKMDVHGRQIKEVVLHRIGGPIE